MSEIDFLRTQEYSTNLELLSQQKMAKFAENTMTVSASGAKAFRMMSQIDSTDAVSLNTRATPAMNVDVVHDGRWVYPKHYAWGRVVDDIDLLQTNISPQGSYAQSAIAALNRQADDDFLTAFFGTAQTGETGGTSTVFDTNNQVSVNEGGTTSGINIDKLRNAQKILLDNEVDIDAEDITIGISPYQHDELLGLTQVVSTDFNTRPVLGEDGRVRSFMGMNIVISTRLPADGSGYRRLPVWVKSGMGRGVWESINGVVRKRSDLQFNPDYVEAGMRCGFTRLEEAKCVEIKCNEA
jgi:hypothetical protein